MPIRERVAEELRVLLARRRMSATELARRTQITQPYLSRRMTGEIAFDLDDLEKIARALGVKVLDLLPRGDTETYPTLAAKPTVRPIRLPTQRSNRRPGDGRPVGHPGGARRPDGSRRTSRIA